MPDSSNDLFLAIGRLEGKVDSVLSMLALQEQRLEDIEVRVRGLEAAKAWIMGAAATVSAGVSYIINNFQ